MNNPTTSVAIAELIDYFTGSLASTNLAYGGLPAAIVVWLRYTFCNSWLKVAFNFLAPFWESSMDFIEMVCTGKFKFLSE
ncbi:hypothetical protein CEN47_08215 [Fischerella thermalis CCMEE 5319]|nr:hypothetical protein CEN47_08215 [Fischerella thermalis CCMEE 5319]